ncbi:carbamoyltransferase HypF [Mastigocoleus sp. MO_188.B34]|uniref:carbamoyltransferase HypF n=1 Tax=Mastigocoleus sp. MO_188.B34 TaxID=3036635 RepID=UPI002633D29E|nr:carbamoyltransferase HypF [Mastigocoleus sp. MO_188.B34]MDJ0695144.1 carbamoyltransferase HypF [Mastigocoleus sp. MO_188.B34]
MPIEEIRISGTVQGVGFRPTVYRLAKACELKGNVCNDGEGVLIQAYGSKTSIEKFIHRLYAECPPLAKIDQLKRTPYQGKFDYDDFVISDSITTKVKTEIAPDAATCPQCQKEIFDPLSRYYRYPFTNCTNCGPRLSIIRAIPYDRCNTSMKLFSMCSQCKQEYNDVTNRRFHAQPVACYTCGPQVWLERADGKPITAAMFSMVDDIDAVCTLLQKGEIVAIKGLGGFHLACDATNEAVVQKLRDRKQRFRKPFALMARDITIIEKYCILNPKERELLESPAAPIVLLGIREWELGNGDREIISQEKFPAIAKSVAPGQKTLGFMLPYTPLHHLILRRMERPIVLTSGNISDEPQCIDNNEAKTKLNKIADYFLFHNRDILNRVDDSVVRVVNDNPKEITQSKRLLTLRRARGYAPAPLNLPPGFEKVVPVLGMGGELKNTFCLLQNGRAVLSQYLGDLENAATFRAYQETLNLYLNLFEHHPKIIAIDKHPEYLSSKLGKELAIANQIKLENIQHHHAHIAACMAENNIPLDTSPILGIALDGLGYGEDGTIWGGEFLLADYRQFTRLATFKPVAMIGGEKAIYQPWRNTYAHLTSDFNWQEIQQKYSNLEIINFLESKPLPLLNQLQQKQINSPLASSVGRLFDAVAAAIGICPEECSYEGQAAIEMEALINNRNLENCEKNQTYPFQIKNLDKIYYMDPHPMWEALLNDLQSHVGQQMIATKFHLSLAIAITQIVDLLRQKYPIDRVVLTGGVFQNKILLQQTIRYLSSLGIKILTHSLIPPNDSNLSLGQTVISAARNVK